MPKTITITVQDALYLIGLMRAAEGDISKASLAPLFSLNEHQYDNLLEKLVGGGGSVSGYQDINRTSTPVERTYRSLLDCPAGRLVAA